MKKVVSTLILALTLSVLLSSAVPAAAAPAGFVTGNNFVTSGLVAFYSSLRNTETGYSNTAASWFDLSGEGRHIPLQLGVDKASWTADGLSVAKLHTVDLPNELKSAFYSADGFTVQIKLGDFAYNAEAGSSAWVNIFGMKASDTESFSVYYNFKVQKITFEMKKSTTENATCPTVMSMAELSQKVITITYKNGQGILYLDGVQGAAKAFTVGLPDSAASVLRLGHDKDTLSADVLKIKTLAIYNRALSATEVLDNANADKAAVADTTGTTAATTTAATTTAATTTAAATTSPGTADGKVVTMVVLLAVSACGVVLSRKRKITLH